MGVSSGSSPTAVVDRRYSRQCRTPDLKPAASLWEEVSRGRVALEAVKGLKTEAPDSPPKDVAQRMPPVSSGRIGE